MIKNVMNWKEKKLLNKNLIFIFKLKVILLFSFWLKNFWWNDEDTWNERDKSKWSMLIIVSFIFFSKKKKSFPDKLKVIDWNI